MRDALWSVMSKGAQVMAPDALLPAAALLDLYGEDIRARAYVTQDPVLGEMMLRPDYTVPVVQAHMAGGVAPARYTYQGPVWRKQTAASGRAREYGQIGLEVFDGTNPAAANADVFDTIMRALDHAGVNGRAVITGDIALMRSAVASLQMSELRRGALMRHLWRPNRFNALLARFAGEADHPQGRDALSLEALDTQVADAGPAIGLRSPDTVIARVQRLVGDRDEVKVPRDQVTALRALQAMSTNLSEAADAALALVAPLPLLSPAIDSLRAWADAIASKGYDPAKIEFRGAYGLTSMEYYDGFVFGVSVQNQLVATGGRDDALTAALGGGSKMAAVGAVIRPDSLQAALS